MKTSDYMFFINLQHNFNTCITHCCLLTNMTFKLRLYRSQGYEAFTVSQKNISAGTGGSLLLQISKLNKWGLFLKDETEFVNLQITPEHDSDPFLAFNHMHRVLYDRRHPRETRLVFLTRIFISFCVSLFNYLFIFPIFYLFGKQHFHTYT